MTPPPGSRRIAYLTGRRWRGRALPPGALPDTEAADFAILQAAAAAKGLSLEVAFWDDPDLPAAGFAAALIRSTWDYHERLEEFLTALERLEAAGLALFNPSALVRWNARKTYLRDLAAAGVPTIPTMWTDRAEPADVARAFETFDAAELVLKPQVGAGARATIRLRRNGWSTHDLALGPAGPAMIQPFLPDIEYLGEVSVFLFGGAPAHVVRKRPPAGGWLANARDAQFSAIAPDPGMIALARAAVAASPLPPLYVRVDLAPEGRGRLLVIELEAIEPALFLTYAPSAADRLAEALAAAVFSG